MKWTSFRIKKIWLIGIFFVVPVTALLFTNCGREGFATLTNFDPQGEGLASTTAPPAVLPKTTANLHVLNGEQAVHSMLSLTGTPKWSSGLDYAVQNLGIMLGLTYNPQLEEFVGTSQIAIMNFSQIVCAEAVSSDLSLPLNDPSRRIVPGGVKHYLDSKDWPAGTLDQATKNMARLFWGREPYPEEQLAVQTALDEFKSEPPLANTDPTETFFTFLCTGMLSSLETMTY